jgi:DNA-binding response OmpR family regulator
MTVENCLLVTAQTGLTHLPWGLIVDNTMDAVEVCKRRKFQAVFGDYGALRERSNGLRLARALRAASTNLPIYLLSDRPDVIQVQAALHAGATDLMLRDAVALSRVLALLVEDTREDASAGARSREHFGQGASGVEIKRLEHLLGEAAAPPPSPPSMRHSPN